MAKKNVGYVELEWICPNCNSRNKGSEKVCAGCGAAQPADVKFIQPAEEKIIEAKDPDHPTGPDVHCPFCGVRNPSSAKVCSECGGDLSGAQKRESGEVLGAHRVDAAPSVICAACGESNQANNLRCLRCGAPLPAASQSAPVESPVKGSKQPLPVALIVILAVIGVLVIFFLTRLFASEDVTAEVTSRSWERSVTIEQFGPVSSEDWADEVPPDAENIVCKDRYRGSSSQPAPKATEVCGTPYTVDQGDGTGLVVQDCQYLVYDSYCEYKVNAWSAVRLETLQGGEEPPTWPSPLLKEGQRTGNTSESFSIIFSTADGERHFTTSNMDLFTTAEIGSRWILSVNGFGEITGIEPAQ